MAKVIMHEAKDGSLHKTQGLCDAKNIELRLAPAVEAFVGALGAETVGLTIDEEGAGINLSDLTPFLIAHADALRKILNDALVSRKPRGKGKEKKAPVAVVVAPAPAANDADALDSELEALGL